MVPYVSAWRLRDYVLSSKRLTSTSLCACRNQENLVSWNQAWNQKNLVSFLCLSQPHASPRAKDTKRTQCIKGHKMDTICPKAWGLQRTFTIVHLGAPRYTLQVQRQSDTNQRGLDNAQSSLYNACVQHKLCGLSMLSESLINWLWCPAPSILEQICECPYNEICLWVVIWVICGPMAMLLWDSEQKTGLWV